MSKRKLLLADDSITIQKVVNLTFADEGIEVIAVGDGDSAMQKFEEFMPDLVMADVNMPGLSGYEICQIVKQNEITRHIPVILLVGSFEPFDEEQASQVGADDFLTKPFQSIRQLVNKVTELLNRNHELPVSKSSVSDSLSDTLEFDKQEQPVEDYGDAGMDDDMIETSPANEFAPVPEPFHRSETTIDYAKTQPLNPDDLKAFRVVSDSDDEVVESSSDDADVPRDSEIPAPEGEVSGAEEPKLEYYSPEPISEMAAPAFDEPVDESFETETETVPALDDLDPFVAPEHPAEDDDTEATVSFSETSAPVDDDVVAGDDSAMELPVEDDVPAVEETGETEDTVAETEYAVLDVTTESDDLPVLESASEESAVEEPAEPAFDAPTEEAALETGDEVEEEVAEVPAIEHPAPVEFVDETPVSAAMNIPSLGYDDGDLLDLPPLVEETGIRPSLKTEAFEEPAEDVAEPVEDTGVAPEPETVAVAEAPGNVDVMQSFPPELIEAIARKVAEQISAKTMSDVLPQITEMVMKKLAEEKKE